MMLKASADMQYAIEACMFDEQINKHFLSSREAAVEDAEAVNAWIKKELNKRGVEQEVIDLWDTHY